MLRKQSARDDDNIHILTSAYRICKVCPSFMKKYQHQCQQISKEPFVLYYNKAKNQQTIIQSLKGHKSKINCQVTTNNQSEIIVEFLDSTIGWDGSQIIKVYKEQLVRLRLNENHNRQLSLGFDYFMESAQENHGKDYKNNKG